MRASAAAGGPCDARAESGETAAGGGVKVAAESPAVSPGVKTNVANAAADGTENTANGTDCHSLARSIGIQTRCSKNNGARRTRKERARQRKREKGERRVYLLMVPSSCTYSEGDVSRSVNKRPGDHTRFKAVTISWFPVSDV